MLGLPAAGEVEVLNDDNAASYWERSDLFDMALDLTAGRRGLAALGKVIERWVAHLLAVEVEVEPLIEATDVDLVWYVGLDAEAARGSATHCGTARSSMPPRASALSDCTGSLSERPACLGAGPGRAHLSDIGDDARPDAAHEAAKSRHRPADRASRGGVVSVAPALASIAVGVVVERRKAQSPWIDFIWRPLARAGRSAGGARHGPC